jgi:hypothetical protein
VGLFQPVRANVALNPQWCLIAHEAHHRGQMLLLARQLGHPVDKSTSFGMWEWGVR